MPSSFHTERYRTKMCILSRLFFPEKEDSYLAYKQSQGCKYMLQSCGRLVNLEEEHVGVKDPFHR